MREHNTSLSTVEHHWLSSRPGNYRVEPWLGPLVAIGVVASIIVAAQLSALAPLIGHATSASISGHDPNQLLGFLLTSQAVCIVLGVVVAIIGPRGEGSRLSVLARTAALRSPVQGVRAFVVAAALIIGMLTITFGLVFVTGWSVLLNDLKSGAQLVRGPRWVETLLAFTVGAPLSEELLFRGILTAALARSRLGFWPGAMVANVLWTALHLHYSIIGLAEIALVGILFTGLLAWSGSLWVPIFAHSLYNGLLFLIVRFLPLPL